LIRRNRPHGNDQWTMKNSSRLARDIGDKHRDIFIFFDVANGNL
jgi:hypothetical protein